MSDSNKQKIKKKIKKCFSVAQINKWFNEYKYCTYLKGIQKNKTGPKWQREELWFVPRKMERNIINLK